MFWRFREGKCLKCPPWLRAWFEAFQPASEASERRWMFVQKKERIREKELKKNEGAMLKFVNISSDTISPNEMYEISSASTSNSIPEV